MADISISCAICGTMQNVSASCAGQTVRCPVCNSPLKVPGALAPDAGAPPSLASAPPPAPQAPDAATPAAAAEKPAGTPAAAAAPVVAQAVSVGAPRLSLTKDRTADGEGRKCPACDSTMGTDDIVCSQCGYNTKTGRSMAELAAKREAFGRALATAGALLIVLAAGFGAWWLGWFRGREPEPEAAPEPVSSNLEVAVAATNPPGPPPPPPPEVIEQVRTELKALLDRNCPQAHEGDRVNIELTTSRIVRGILRAGTEPGTIVIETGTNQVETIQLKQLKSGSRLQCDPEFRVQELDRQVQKRLAL